MAGTLRPLFDSVVGGGTLGRSYFHAYGSNAAVPSSTWNEGTEIGLKIRIRRFSCENEICCTIGLVYQQTFLDFPLLVAPHSSLNSGRGIICEPDSLSRVSQKSLKVFQNRV
ncbi:hypothetical protein TNCV_3414041 [Trichonephila clavipes]|uniref:Uncharacterized protein n=1 Tax=Trichonephila clavipes TaxID=2585209 RepID=A0A8X6RK14_TRICX|nr:hypothetical protein TNCV_3414041 [Trichonephila clavipes]